MDDEPNLHLNPKFSRQKPEIGHFEQSKKAHSSLQGLISTGKHRSPQRAENADPGPVVKFTGCVSLDWSPSIPWSSFKFCNVEN